MASRSPAAAKSLYRRILRAHQRYLPTEMRELGTTYVRSEFQLHKSVTKKDQLDQFFVAWEEYLDQILTTARAQESLSSGAVDENKRKSGDEKSSALFEFGKDLDSNIELTDEQQEQLQKLKEEAEKPRL